MINYRKRDVRESRCSVCNYPVMVDEHGNGDACANCGWIQDAAATRNSDSVGLANLISLDKARKLFMEGRPFKPDFDDFIEFYEMYGEVEFTHKKVVYGMDRADNEGVNFWSCDAPARPGTFLVFENIEAFVENASIDGVLLRDLWDEVENLGTL